MTAITHSCPVSIRWCCILKREMWRSSDPMSGLREYKGGKWGEERSWVLGFTHGRRGQVGGGIDRLCGKICKVSIFKAESEECRLLYPKAWRLTVCRPCTPGTPASPSVHPPPMDATYTYSVLITHLSTVGPLSQKSCCNGVPSKSSVSVCLTVSMTRNSLLFCHDERGGNDGLRIRRGKKRSQMFTLPCLYSSLSVAPSLYLSMWMHFKCCGGFFFFSQRACVDVS